MSSYHHWDPCRASYERDGLVFDGLLRTSLCAPYAMTVDLLTIILGGETRQIGERPLSKGIKHARDLITDCVQRHEIYSPDEIFNETFGEGEYAKQVTDHPGLDLAWEAFCGVSTQSNQLRQNLQKKVNAYITAESLESGKYTVETDLNQESRLFAWKTTEDSGNLDINQALMEVREEQEAAGLPDYDMDYMTELTHQIEFQIRLFEIQSM
jgi:hypothetical protein